MVPLKVAESTEHSYAGKDDNNSRDQPYLEVELKYAVPYKHGGVPKKACYVRPLESGAQVSESDRMPEG